MSASLSSARRQEAATGYLFALPYLLLFLVFMVGPMAYGFYISLHEWHILGRQKPFVGLANYRALLADDLFGIAMLNTAYFALLTVIPGNALSLLLAMGLNARIRGETALKTAFYLPVVLSVAVVAIIWRWAYSTEFGWINHYLRLLGLPPAAWLNSPKLAMPSLALMSIWWGAGGQMLIYLAGLRGIPEELYEAAMIDGAGARARFRHVTLPMLRPTLLFCLVMAVIGSSQVFGQSYILTAGGPLYSTLTVALYMYQTGFSLYRLGYACAVAYALFVVVLGITLVQFRLLYARREGEAR
ncbi:MAG: sugar ABC transporter permease [Chthonomonadales bacterium]|nr:sugar ABC transporter permease [Chthonomonadales bacterium]